MKKIKELAQSDILATLINLKNTTDHTQDLKDYLYKANPQMVDNQYDAQQQFLLPQFASQQMTEQQLIQHHFKRKKPEMQSVVNYEHLLQSVEDKMQKIINSYSDSFEKSNLAMQQLINKLGQSSQFLTRERKPLKNLSQHITNKYLAIVTKIVRIKNMERTLDILKFWNQTHISRVLRVKPEDITNHNNLQQLLTMFQDIEGKLAQRKNQFANYSNLVSLIRKRKTDIIAYIYQNAIESVLNYQNQQQFMTVFMQYQQVLASGIFKDSKVGLRLGQWHQSIFSLKVLPKVVDVNVLHLYQKSLEKSKELSRQASHQDSFLCFYNLLFSAFTQYFNCWHKATTFHVQHQTIYKQSFIQLRTTVFQKMLEKVQHSLKYDSRVDGLPLSKLMLLFSTIQNFLEQGEEWMGKCQSNLPHILNEKYQQQVTNFSRIKNGELKRFLFDQFQILAQHKQQWKSLSDSQILQVKLKTRQDLLKQIEECRNRDSRKKSRFILSNSNTQKNGQNSLQPLSLQKMNEDMNLYLERLNSHFGVALYRLMSEYQIRQNILPLSQQLPHIYQHFQYCITLLYKVCIPNYMKKAIEQDIFNDFKRSNKLSIAKSIIAKNTVDQQLINNINQLRHIFIDRSTFGNLYDFVSNANQKYQGISLNSYINVNLYYQEGEKYQHQIGLLSHTFLNLMNQLFLLADYLQKLAGRATFPTPSQDLSVKIATLKNIIASLLIFYFTTYFECFLHRFYSQVVPLFLGLKFQVKKLQDFKGSLKEYKIKLTQLYSKISVQKYSRHTFFNKMIIDKQTQYFFKFVIDLFSRIQKTNDNGRQILKQEIVEIIKIAKAEGVTKQNQWPGMLTTYMELSKERNQRVILQKVELFVLKFPLQWWRSGLLWLWNDCSSRQKKQLSNKIANIYINKIASLPSI